jgi:hypothetical protein
MSEIIDMLEYSEDLKLKNHITSTDSQFLAKVQSKVGASDKVRWGKSPLVEINPFKTDNYAKRTKPRYLLICESCLWCASYIKNQTTFTKCPLCYNGEIDCMPIDDDKNGFFDYNHSKSVELKFADNIRC